MVSSVAHNGATSAIKNIVQKTRHPAFLLSYCCTRINVTKHCWYEYRHRYHKSSPTTLQQQQYTSYEYCHSYRSGTRYLYQGVLVETRSIDTCTAVELYLKGVV